MKPITERIATLEANDKTQFKSIEVLQRDIKGLMWKVAVLCGLLSAAGSFFGSGLGGCGG